MFDSVSKFDVIEFRKLLLNAVDAEENRVTRRCLKIVSDLADSFKHSSQLRCLKADLNAIENGRTKDDKHYYLAAIKLDPLNAYAYESLGHIANIDEELASAEVWFQKSIAASQGVNAYIGLIDVLHQQGNRDKALSVAAELDSYVGAQTAKAVETRQRLG